MHLTTPAPMLAATLPLAAPPELRALAERVFRDLAAVRFAPVASVLAVAGPHGLTPEILDRWVAAGLLVVGTVTTDAIAGTAIRYVALAPAGARALAAATGLSIAALSPSRLRRTTQKRAHDLAVGDLALAVLALAHEGAVDLIGLECDDKKLGTAAVIIDARNGPSRVALEADLLVVLDTERGPSALLVEVDRGTVAVRTMRTKYAGYRAWQLAGGPLQDFGTAALRVLTLVPDDRRLAALHAAALDATGGKRSGFFLFGTLADASARHPERLLEPLAVSLGSASARVPVFCRHDTVSETSRPPGSRAGLPALRDGARPKSYSRLGIPVPQAPNRLPAGPAPSQAWLL